MWLVVGIADLGEKTTAEEREALSRFPEILRAGYFFILLFYCGFTTNYYYYNYNTTFLGTWLFHENCEEESHLLDSDTEARS